MSSTRYRAGLAVLAAASLAFGISYFRAIGSKCSAQPAKRFERTVEAMDTFVTVSVSGVDEAAAAETMDAAFAEVERLEALLSRFEPDSDISMLNFASPGEAVKVSPATLAVLCEAARVSDLSDGAFDVTVGPLVALWREAGKSGALPADEDIDAAREKVSFKDVSLDAESNTVTSAREGLVVDLSAVAKGFVAERAAVVLIRRGITSGFVDAGGDVMFIGSNADGRPWRTGIEDPLKPGTVADTLYVRNRAVVTSGNYRRFCTIDGKRYSHIIDPRTGRPSQGPAGVTVIAPGGAAADAWATALSVLGKDGADAARRAGVEFLMYFVEDGEINRFESEGFAAFRKDGTNDQR
ncbi:MAG: FAD:protein FMN transferase [Planctomycetes bacterium]|nr:FAD:protein FMN transferase [Planctomycetota bacterium]